MTQHSFTGFLFVIIGMAVYVVMIFNGLIAVKNDVTKPGPISTSCSNSGMTSSPNWWKSAKAT